MQVWIRSLTQLAYRPNTIVARWRAARMRAFRELVKPPPGARIVDLGGTVQMWSLVEHDYRITLVNLPGGYGADADAAKAAGIDFVLGDACDLKATFGSQSFDVVFSNSVIEHVGGAERQAAFANEVRRLAPAYWVQTPSDRFPIEPHTGVPYYFRLPQSAREALERRWYAKLPAWTETIRGTTVLSRARMQELFPDADLFIEKKFLFEKSYACYRPAR